MMAVQFDIAIVLHTSRAEGITNDHLTSTPLKILSEFRNFRRTRICNFCCECCTAAPEKDSCINYSRGKVILEIEIPLRSRKPVLCIRRGK
jgi:hypothetical protein